MHKTTAKGYRDEFGEVNIISEAQMHIRQRNSERVKQCIYAHWEPFYTNEYILGRLYFYHKSKMSIHARSVTRYDAGLRGAIFEHFGAWDDALRKLKLNPRKIRKNRHANWSKAFIVKCILNRKELGLALNPKHLREDNKMLYVTIRTYFSSYNAAFEEAGLDANEYRLAKRSF